jgi:hypothetical protein
MNTTFVFILAFVTLGLFITLVTEVIVSNSNLHKKPLLQVACAGSENPCTANKVCITDFNWDELPPLNDQADKYRKFIISGQSMLLGGIQNNDIIFVESIKKIDNFEFPAIIVLKREPIAMEKASQVDDKAEYKVRRTWGCCRLDQSDGDIVDIVKRIVEGERFQKLKDKDANKFPEESLLVEDFKRRLHRYREEHENCANSANVNYIALISTTLDTQKNKVHFSMHSKNTLIGKVKYAYGIANT